MQHLRLFKLPSVKKVYGQSIKKKTHIRVFGIYVILRKIGG